MPFKRSNHGGENEFSLALDAPVIDRNDPLGHIISSKSLRDKDVGRELRSQAKMTEVRVTSFEHHNFGIASRGTAEHRERS